jgi:hypothetical protein
MVKKLFVDFLDNVVSYRSCESIWEKMFEDLATSMNQGSEWRRWIPRSFANGTPMELDGNPIFDARSDRLGKAFRIMQHEPTGEAMELAAWIKSYEAEFTVLPRSELFLNLSLSDESLEAATKMLKKWMSPDTTLEEMQTYIAEHYPADDV